MAMGRRRKRIRQEGLWTATAALPVGASHPFYQWLNQILDEKKFDEYVEAICEDFYAGEVGRPGLSPGIYFRPLMVGYFEGIDSERGIAWRASDSLSIRSFVRIALDEGVPDHSTISRTRRLMDVETHQAVFQWVLQVLAEKKLLKGTTIGVDATTLEANAALRSIVRRDTGERYEEFLIRLAKESSWEGVKPSFVADRTSLPHPRRCVRLELSAAHHTPVYRGADKQCPGQSTTIPPPFAHGCRYGLRREP